MRRKLPVKAYVIIVICLGVTVLAAAWMTDTPSVQTDAADNGAYGTESVTTEASALEEVKMPQGIPDYIVRYQPMTVSFNRQTHQPNWVAWELTGKETEGENERSKSAGFAADPNVPGCLSPDAYRGSGYDRGHMAPAGDMKWSAPALNQSFLMTNICAQAGELNRGAWKKLEEKCRQRAKVDSAIVIVCGPIFTKGERRDTIVTDVGTRIPVADAFFKVVLSPYSNPPQAIGFIMPNGMVKGGMQACAVSVDSVETRTGYDFFSALPDDIENRVETQCNFNRWSRLLPAAINH